MVGVGADVVAGCDVLSGRVVLGDNGGGKVIALYNTFLAFLALMSIWVMVIIGAIWIGELFEKLIPEEKVIAFWRRVWQRVRGRI